MDRAIWQVIMSGILTDENAQRRGIVIVLFGERLSLLNTESPRELIEPLQDSLWQSLPVHISGFHFCCLGGLDYIQRDDICLSIGKNTRMRFRSHCGKNDFRLTIHP